jgi:NADH dehydrogenase
MRRHVLVVGGGFAGLTAARRLLRRLPADIQVTLVNPHPYMTYQPLLPETAAGSVQPAHVAVPLRRALPGARVLTGTLTGFDPDARVATVTGADGDLIRLAYDELVLAVGSVTRTLPVPGLVEHAIGFRTVEEAVHLHNRVLSRLDLAATTTDPATRSRALTFVFVGAGYAGVEALAEVEDMARRACAQLGTVSHADTRWVLVEAAERILPQLPTRLAAYAARRLSRRGVDIRTGTRLESCTDGGVRLSDGEYLPSETVVWTAGVVGAPVLRHLGLPGDVHGRVSTDEFLRVTGLAAVWSLGDCAAVPDLATGGSCPPTAQHALRQATRLADNLTAHLRGRPLNPYRHRDAGAVASLGLRQGVAELYGMPLRGYPAWVLHRLYHGSRLPSSGRRLQVMLTWLLGSRARDPVALHALETPHHALRSAHHQQTAVPMGGPR